MKFIEIEGFKHENRFIIKELCVLDDQNPLCPLYYIFKEEFPFTQLTLDEQRQVAFVSGNLHGLTWKEGITQFCASCVERKIIEDFDNNGLLEFYTMGEEKVKFLSDLFPRLRILHVKKTFKLLPYLMPHITCLHRPHGERCALRKCYRLLLSFSL